jgi:hypothetical protein
MKTFVIIMTAILLTAGSALAQMGGGHMGGGTGGGHMGGGGSTGGGTGGGSMAGGASHMGGGMGYGMGGVGGIMSGMMGNTISHGYLYVLSPIQDPDAARTAFRDFLAASTSSLVVSNIWDYPTAYVAEIEDTSGAKAFDLIADKLTGTVGPEMGLSMMLNASYGKSMYKVSGFAKKLTLTAEQALTITQAFIDKNPVLSNNGFTPQTAEAYPGYYKFHTLDALGGFGPDIMVNGYNGGIWMNTLLGVPIAGPIAPATD